MIFFVQFLKIVHRIGRTGRSSNKGLATTFINKSNEESVLLDLKHLLIEAKQNVPPFLATLQSETEMYNLELGGKTSFLKYFLTFSTIHAFFILSFLKTRVAVTVAVSVIVSRSAPNWKPKATNKSRLSDAKITYRILLQTTDYSIYRYYFSLKFQLLL